MHKGRDFMIFNEKITLSFYYKEEISIKSIQRNSIRFFGMDG